MLKILCCYLSVNGIAVEALPETVVLNFYLLIFPSRVSMDSLFNSGSRIRCIHELKCKDRYLTRRNQHHPHLQRAAMRATEPGHKQMRYCLIWIREKNGSVSERKVKWANPCSSGSNLITYCSKEGGFSPLRVQYDIPMDLIYLDRKRREKPRFC